MQCLPLFLLFSLLSSLHPGFCLRGVSDGGHLWESPNLLIHQGSNRRLATGDVLNRDLPVECGDSLCLVQALLNKRPQIFITKDIDLQGVGILPTIDRRVSISGICDEKKCSLDAGGTAGIFVVGLGGYLTLKDLQLTGGFCNRGAAVLVSGQGADSPVSAGKLEALNVRFHKNIATEVGGAVAIESGGSAYVKNSVFYNNKANKGGAVYVGGSTKLPTTIGLPNPVTNPNPSSAAACSFRSCTTFANTQFTRNQADGTGGAVYVDDAEPDCVGEGGAQLDCTTCTFVNNTADQDGGAIQLAFVSSGATANTKESAFISNTAGQNGGDVNVQKSQPGTPGAQFRAYSSSYAASNATNGPAVAVGTGASANFSKCDFTYYTSIKDTACDGTCNFTCPVQAGQDLNGFCPDALPPAPLCPWIPEECPPPLESISPPYDGGQRPVSQSPPTMNSNPPPPIVNVSPPTNPSTSPELSPPSNATTPGGMNSPPSNPPTPKLPPASPSNPPSSPAPPVPLVPPPSPPVLSPPTTPSFPSSNPPPSNPSFNESPPPPSKKKWPSPPQGEGSVENAPPAPPPPPTPYSSPPPTPYSSPPPPSGNTASPVPTNRSNSPPPPGSQGKVKNAPSVPPSRSSTSYSSPPPPFLSTSPPPSKEKWWRPPPPQGDGSIENAPPAPPPPPTPSYSSPPSPANKQPGRNPPSQGNSEEAPPAPPPSSKRKQRSPPLGTGSVESAPPAPPGSPSSSITGDPHFVGKHGERFDFHGKDGRDYCVVSDHNIHMNMHVFHGKRRKSTFISKLGILYKGQKILIDVHNNSQKSHSWTLTVDDVEMDDINTMSTRTGLTITQGINFIRIVVPEEVDILVDIVRATFGRRGSLKDYINLHVKQLAVSTEVHGILGQTYLDTAYALEKLRAAKGKKRSRAAKVLVDGSESDYLTSSILSPDCKYSNFEDQASWHSRIQRTLFESVKGLLPLHLSNRVSVVTDCVGFGDENVVCKA